MQRQNRWKTEYLPVDGLHDEQIMQPAKSVCLEQIDEMAQYPLRFPADIKDGLTSMFHFSYLKDEYPRLNRSLQVPISVVICDLNGLKHTNRALGYEAGDQSILNLAKIVKMCLTNGGVGIRSNGGEFCLLLPCTDFAQAQMICSRTKKLYDLYVNSQENSIRLPSLSMGCSTKCDAAESLESTILEAENRLNLSKMLDEKSCRGAFLQSIKSFYLHLNRDIVEHSQRVGALALDFGKTLKLNHSQLVEFELLAWCHDIGKFKIDTALLQKSSPLTPDEWRTIQTHSELGYRMLNALPELQRIAHCALCHHERWDGKGYPNGLGGESIPFLARALSILDAFDAMTMHRPYRSAVSKQEAFCEIAKCSGSQFDPELVAQFCSLKESRVPTAMKL